MKYITLSLIILLGLASCDEESREEFWGEETEETQDTPKYESVRGYTPPKKEKKRIERDCTKCSNGNCRRCAGDGDHLCSLHDTNEDGYCSNCSNLGHVACVECSGTGACKACDGKGYFEEFR